MINTCTISLDEYQKLVKDQKEYRDFKNKNYLRIELTYSNYHFGKIEYVLSDYDKKEIMQVIDDGLSARCNYLETLAEKVIEKESALKREKRYILAMGFVFGAIVGNLIWRVFDLIEELFK
jgi:hypothetical protein